MEDKKEENNWQILLYYKYVYIADPEAEKVRQMALCKTLDLKGRIIVATEGINGTVEGTVENTEAYIKAIETGNYFANTCPVENPKGSQGKSIFCGMNWKKSIGTGNAFPRLSIKTRKEIVSLHLEDGAGICDVDPNQVTGIHLKPEELHEWIKTGKEFYIVDMRNAYEHKVGHFEGSILPPIENFRDLPKVVEQIKHLKNKTVLTVCTGGVRCEKASGFLITQGFTDAYQLENGIVSYMEKYPNEDFKGKLYVFDSRVAMGFYTDDPKHEVVAKCDSCKEKSENYVNCANPVCHRHFIACAKCVEKGGGQMFCPNGCIISRHGRPVRQLASSSFDSGDGKISPVEADLV